MNIIFKEDNLIKFSSLWEEYIKNNNINFQYSTILIKYYLSYANNLLYDKSFIIEQNNQCVGICFLPIEKVKDDKLSISINNSYIIAPLTKTKKIEKEIFNQIDDISTQLNIQQIKFYLSTFKRFDFNKLLKYNFINTATTTCSIDLKLSQDILWTNLQKSYKSLINSFVSDDNYSIIISNSTNNIELHNKYVHFHKEHMIQAKATPKEDKIYQAQYNLLDNNLATIIAIKFNNTIIMTNYFFHDTKNVTYASSAYDTNKLYSKLSLNHYLLWKAIIYFKHLDLDILNFGQPCGFNYNNGQDDYLTDKQINISNFKRGMGAQMKTLYRGSKEYLLKS